MNKKTKNNLIEFPSTKVQKKKVIKEISNKDINQEIGNIKGKLIELNPVLLTEEEKVIKNKKIPNALIPIPDHDYLYPKYVNTDNKKITDFNYLLIYIKKVIDDKKIINTNNLAFFIENRINNLNIEELEKFKNIIGYMLFKIQVDKETINNTKEYLELIQTKVIENILKQ